MIARSLFAVIAAASWLAAAAAIDWPPIPPLPADSWPAAEQADPFARALLERVPARALAARLEAEPGIVPRILRNLGTAELSGDPALRGLLDTYIAAVAREAATNSKDVRLLVSISVLDPLRYGEEPAFRERIDARLPATLARLPPAATRAVLEELTRSAALDFDTAEAIAVTAHLSPRRSSERKVPFDGAGLRMPDDLSGPIEASFYSLNSAFFTPDEVRPFLAAVHSAEPDRRIVVLGDDAMRRALAADLDRLRVSFVDDDSRSFTPWPRDPFIIARSGTGGVVFINRPNAQPKRAEDQNMVRAIVQGLPPGIDAAWNHPRWTIGPAPFHNGDILLTPAAVWISIHTVEARALDLLGFDHVPLETFAQPAELERYMSAVRRAAAELERFYGRPVRFVHALPDAEGRELMERLGGGAGIDLDSIVTILPRGGGRVDALVGDLRLGVQAARQAPASEWPAIRTAYGFRDNADALSTAVADVQNAPQTLALQRFLDEIAGELQRDGMTVRRLPLLNIPATMLARDDIARDSSFLITWNNVTLEQRGDVRRAEGFASHFNLADRAARQVFAASGYRLDLFPPLVSSIVLSGGYRCASNHLRP